MNQLVVLTGLIAWVSVPAHAQNTAPPLPIDALLTAPTLPLVSDVAIAPDGRSIAYTVIDNRRRSRWDERRASGTGVGRYWLGGDIWVSDLTAAKVQRLTDSDDNWGPSWSPDGRFLVFFSDRRTSEPARQTHLWIRDQASGALRQVSNLPVRDYRLDHIEWLADSRTVVVRTYPEDLSPARYASLVAGRAGLPANPLDTGVTVSVVSFDPTVKDAVPHTDQLNPDRWLSDLAVVDVSTGGVQRIAAGQRNCTYTLSPDRQSLAVTVMTRAERPGSQRFLVDLMVYDLASGQSRRVAVDAPIGWDGAWSAFSWSPTGHAIAYRTGDEGHEIVADDQLFVVSTDRATTRAISSTARTSALDQDGPLWDGTGQHVFFVRGGALWRAAVDGSGSTPVAAPSDRRLRAIEGPSQGQLWSPDGGRTTIVMTLNPVTKRMGFARADLATGAIAQLVEGNETIQNGYTRPVVTPDGTAAVYAAEDPQHPRNLWLVRALATARPRAVTDIAPELRRYGSAKAAVLEWRSLDGDTLRGALIYPTEYHPGTRYPLIAIVYGGQDLSDDLNRFGFATAGAPFENRLVYASRGYALLLTDSKLHVGTPMVDLLKSVMPGIDRAIDLGVADPARLGVMGHSYGGYSALSLIAQTTRFRAAIMRAGFGNLLSAYGELSPDGANFMLSSAETGQLRMAGTPWQYRDRYIENSPIVYLDRVTTPLLIIRGDADLGVFATQGDEIFTGLRRLGRRVEYARYAAEGHWEGEWSFTNQMDALTRMVAWFDRYLK